MKLTSPAMARINRAQKATLVGTWVGQGIAMVNQARPAKRVVQELVEEYLEAVETLNSQLG